MINVRLALPHHRLAVARPASATSRVAQRRDRLRGQGRRLAGRSRRSTDVSASRRQGGRQAGLQQISSILGAQLELTPFTGQVLAVRQAVRQRTTSTVFAGVAVMNVKPAGIVARACDQTRARPTRRTPIKYVCGVKGIKIGGQRRRRLPHLLRSDGRAGRRAARRASRSSIRRAATSTATASPTTTTCPGRTRSCSRANLVVYLPSAPRSRLVDRSTQGRRRSCRRRRRRSRSTSAPACWTRPSARRSGRTARSPGSSRPPGGIAREEVQRLPGYGGQAGAEPPRRRRSSTRRQIESL